MRIVALWEDTLEKLAARDFEALVGRLDWVLKRASIERAFSLGRDLDWASPAAKHLDLVYADLDASRGLYWQYERSIVERVVATREIERLSREPPEDTRAWGRTMLLRLGGDAVTDVDWDHVKFRTARGYWSGAYRIDLADPSGFTRAAFAPVVARSTSLEDVLEALEADEPPPRGELNGGANHHGDHAEAQADRPAARSGQWELR
jgi:hypothetical protein